MSDIDYVVKDGIATLTLNRPEQLNAFNNEMTHEMLELCDEVDADDAVRVAVVTGSGRAFSAGADLSAGADRFKGGGSDTVSPSGSPRDGGGVLALRIFRSVKPYIAAINGPAVGMGATVTLPMDIRIAAEKARLGFVFTRRGIVPESCSSWFLPRLVGVQQAAEWLYTGRLFTAAEALQGRLIRSVHAPDDLLDAAYEIAKEIVDHAAPVSVALTRQMVWRMLGAEHPMEAHRFESEAMRWRGDSADPAEGINAFLEKRLPTFVEKVSDGFPAFADWSEPSFD